MRTALLDRALLVFFFLSETIVATGFTTITTTHLSSSAASSSSLSSQKAVVGVGGVPLFIHKKKSSSSSPTTTRTISTMSLATSSSLRGGGGDNDSPTTTKLPFIASLWGTGGVIYILYKAIARVLPIAMEPLKQGSTVTLTTFQWSAYIISCLFFAYAEGYKGFQLKFAPLVVKRSCSLVSNTSEGTIFNILFAPLYSMGLFHATKKRKITSWAVTLGVATIVAIVKRLSEPWRNIIDAGVVVGLSWGTISILLFYMKTVMTGQSPSIDPCLPSSSSLKQE